MTKKYTEIIKQAKIVKTNVKTQYKIGMSHKWGYYFAKALLTPKKDIPTISIDDAPKPSYTKINRKATSKQYLALAKKLVEFIETKHRLPNYLRWGNYKIASNLFTYTFARCLVYREEKGKYSSEIIINQGVFSKPKLKPYITEQGCKGMGQCTPYNCACNALQQSFYRLTGILVPESTIAGWAGTTEDGTGHDGINTAVAAFNKKYGKNVKIKWYNFSELGWAGVEKLMKQGALFFHLLYRDLYGHYEVPKSIGDVLKILNSLGDYCNYPAYCGYIETRSKATQKSYINGISQKSVAFLYNG